MLVCECQYNNTHRYNETKRKNTLKIHVQQTTTAENA